MENELSALTVLFTEFYYWVTVVVMFLIHVGFCLYEVGVSREKNKLNTLIAIENEPACNESGNQIIRPKCTSVSFGNIHMNIPSSYKGAFCICPPINI